MGPLRQVASSTPALAEEEPVPVPQVFKLHLDDASEERTHLMENCMK